MYKLLLVLLLASCGSVYVEEIGEESNEPAPVKAYEVGDIGPSGGWIFYENPSQETGTWKYLEVTNNDYEFSNIAWDIHFPSIFVDTSIQIGSGLSNTERIFDTFMNSYSNEFLYAALTCIDLEVLYEGKSYTNWFLPSLKEVQEIYKNIFLKNIADFETEKTYLSSSDFQVLKSSLVWAQNFDSGVEDPMTIQQLILTNLSSPDLLIRCVRFVY